MVSKFCIHLTFNEQMCVLFFSLFWNIYTHIQICSAFSGNIIALMIWINLKICKNMEWASTSHVYSQTVSKVSNVYHYLENASLLWYFSIHTDHVGAAVHLLLWNEIPGTLASHNCTEDSSPHVSSPGVAFSLIVIMLQTKSLFKSAISHLFKHSEKGSKENIECIE